ncbi:hypothetical protein ACJRO7_009898 [Eucalyptus globulus]|uniref:Protein CHUP1, chloroplastic n=1 Tax=Eucalyptus globulus TaxID=34317 RepID=A0ABD3LA94_EUCGL
MILRASLLILATVAALAVSGNGVVKPSRKRKPHLESSDDEDANRGSRHAEEEAEAEAADANQRRVIARRDENPNAVDEAEETKHLLEELRRRDKSSITHLKRQLRVSSSEADVLKAAVGSLEAEKRHLEKAVRESLVAEKQLEAAEEMIKQCLEKMKAGEIQMKARLETIEERVHGYHSRGKPSREPAFEGKMKTTDDVKLEVMAMNRRNKELELEKRELALQLNSAGTKAASLSAMTEGEAIARAEEEASALKLRNEDLVKQIETLQKQRFGMVEEMVYQKWLNSCLRFEIRDYRTPPPRTPKRDPSKDWSLGSRQEAKSTGHAASDSSGSSQISLESHEIDDTSSTPGSTSASQSSMSKRSSLITKIKRWRNKSKRDIIVDPSPERSPGKRFPVRPGLIRRFSTPVVPEGLSKASKNNLLESPTPEIPSRLSRVSFNDCIGVRNLEPAFEDTLTPAETEPFSHGRYDRTSSQMLTATESRDNAAMVTAEEKARKHGDVTASEATSSSKHRSGNGSEQKETSGRVADKIGPARSPEAAHGLMNQIEARSPGLVSAFIIFIFMLLLVPRLCSWLYFTLMAH